MTDTLPNPSEQADTILPAGGVEEDTERALRLCEALAPGTGQMKILVIDGEPPSKSRPRFTRNGKPYRTKEDVDAEKRTAWNLRRVFPQPWTGNIALGCVFFRPNKQRIDVDNMLKHVCDSANGIAWVDDSQVTAVYGIAELDIDKPRTVLVFAQHHSTLTRGTDNVRQCEHCGKPFPIVGRTTKRFCDAACYRKSVGRDLSEPIPCKQCGKPFRRTTTGQIMCSRECRAESLRGRNRARGIPRSKCADCGKELSHTRGGRCRPCWSATPNGGTP
ncbi:Holliday junction resolvase RusA-like endonuclease [Streptomyces sp. Ag109_O5-1]|uniref:RusA family crossover junction endodeoxyribonuclease n=1 Tax=Streptomyces sp. Ag109_O5-1 TaxID=1938851 RepID=UPI000F4F83E6|nr:RusA family crossover junction endodeoxyribonuclease [Streptomyces sp. Ag109_O5-1]RPE39814.1 Holliday junction resolvase RusA-like endonuclease [Streptomyces sp. Ag109_O5-1]